jgi:hypothetical protein
VLHPTHRAFRSQSVRAEQLKSIYLHCEPFSNNSIHYFCLIVCQINRSQITSFFRHSIMTCLLKDGITEPEETVVARERLCKHLFTATNSRDRSNWDTRNNRGTVGSGVFYAELDVQRSPASEDLSRWASRLSSPREGGFEYLHRSPASRRRRRKGSTAPGGITGPSCSWGI